MSLLPLPPPPGGEGRGRGARPGRAEGRAAPPQGRGLSGTRRPQPARPPLRRAGSAGACRSRRRRPAFRRGAGAACAAAVTCGAGRWAPRGGGCRRGRSQFRSRCRRRSPRAASQGLRGFSLPPRGGISVPWSRLGFPSAQKPSGRRSSRPSPASPPALRQPRLAGHCSGSGAALSPGTARPGPG